MRPRDGRAGVTRPGPVRMALLAGCLGLLLAGTARAQTDASYTVRPGDTLFEIARRHGVTVEALRRWNGLTTDRIRPGQRLRVSPSSTPPAAPPDAPEAPVPYVARPGETLFDIARAFGVPVDTLAAYNDGIATPLAPGQVVRLPARIATTPYTVRPGDTLFGLARRHGITVEALRRLNRLASDRLRVGQQLRLPRPALWPAPPPGTAPMATGRVVVYPESFTGRLTASGHPYHPDHHTVSHRTLPLGTVVRLTVPRTGRSTFAVVTDRGPLEATALMDVSAAVARALRLDDAPGALVEIRRVQ